MKKIKQKDIINFGLDYLEVIGISEKIKNISFIGNGDSYKKDKLFPGYLVKKTLRVLNYQYKIIFCKNGYDCFAYHKGQINGGIETNDFISIYGVAFKIFENISEIFDFINENIVVEKIRRFDLAIDIIKEVDDVYKSVENKKRKGSIFFDDIGKLQTFYIGEKKKSQNRYKLFRCYNKIDDIKRTNRQKLYSDYLDKENVTRLEIEFRSELCKKINLNSLLDRSYIFNLFLNYIVQYTNIFSKFKYEVEKLSVFNKKKSIEDYRYDEILKEKYINIFIGYGKSICEIGVCPTDILIRKNLIKENTKKDIALSIKDGIFRQDMYEFGLNKRYSKDILSDGLDDIIYLVNKDNNA